MFTGVLGSSLGTEGCFRYFVVHFSVYYVLSRQFKAYLTVLVARSKLYIIVLRLFRGVLRFQAGWRYSTLIDAAGKLGVNILGLQEAWTCPFFFATREKSAPPTKLCHANKVRTPAALGWDSNSIVIVTLTKTAVFRVFREAYPGVITITPPKHPRTT